MKPKLCLAGAVLAVGMLASSADAGIVMMYEMDSRDGSGPMTTTVYVDKDRMRSETKGKDMDQVVIFRGDRKLFWALDKREGTYTEMTKDDLKKMKGKLEEARKAYDEQLKNIPPEQRKMMEAMMKDRMPQPPPSTTYRKVGSGVKVSRWTCDRYDGYAGNEKTEEVCTADARQLDLRPEDLRVFEEVRVFFEEVSKQGFAFYRIEGEDGKRGDAYSGVPVRMVGFSKGKPRDRMELKESARRDLEASLFELPSGMRKQKTSW